MLHHFTNPSHDPPPVPNLREGASEFTEILKSLNDDIKRSKDKTIKQINSLNATIDQLTEKANKHENSMGLLK